MGRIKTVLIKRVAHRLMELHSNKFSNNFEKNKEAVDKLVSTSSKKLKNIIAGYITRLVRKGSEPRKPNSRIGSYEDLESYYR